MEMEIKPYSEQRFKEDDGTEVDLVTFRKRDWEKIKPLLAERPKIVTLCGSTKFYRQFVEANYRETMGGKIVLSVGFYPHKAAEVHGEEIGITPKQKEELDALHKRKIDISDEILVLNVGGYIGESTRSEIEHARVKGKSIRWLEPVNEITPRR
jgi:hypothetical protein